MTEKSSETTNKPAMVPAEKQHEQQPEDQTLTFKCEQCEYSYESEKGLRQHTRMKHRISQLDGIDDKDLNHAESEDIKNAVQNPCPLCKDGDNFCTGKCEPDCEECDTVRTFTELDNHIHIMNQHEPKEVLQHFGNDWVTNHMELISRNMEIAQDRYHCGKWDKLLSYLVPLYLTIYCFFMERNINPG